MAASPVAIAIVVPCYNEGEVIAETASRLHALLTDLVQAGKVAVGSTVYFVDDGSQDDTWAKVMALVDSGGPFAGIKLSANRGHQNALFAGLCHAQGGAVVSIDADLQDDIRIIADMVEAFAVGYDVVYGVRRRRDRDTWFKRRSAEFYYRLLRSMGVDVVFNHADYRLLSRRALEALKEYHEVNLFLRGIIPALGYRSTQVYYDRAERFAGESKYPFRKMLSFAVDGITSFSAVPLRMIAALGVVIFAGACLLSGWVLWTRFISGNAVPGWASSVLPMYFLGGVQLLSIGVLGEYVGRIYLESKRRPRFHIEELVGGPPLDPAADSRRLPLV